MPLPTPNPRLGLFATAHLGAMLLFATWAFGGNIPWARTVLVLAGLPALLVTAAALRERLARPGSSLLPFHALWPLLALNLLVLLGQLQPALDTVTIQGGRGYIPRTGLTAWPCSARPDLAWKALLLFDSLYLAGFNLLLTVRSRRLLRLLLLVLAANALALAVFGSLQKLSGATGLYFGAVKSPNEKFFSTFIYRNHWGAYALLMLGVCTGLIFSERTSAQRRDFWHSPAPAATLATLLLAASILLAESRACTALALLLGTAAVLHATLRLWRHRRAQHRPVAGPALAFALALAAAGWGIFSVASASIAARLADTRGQLAHMRETGGIGSRAQLYGDTWRMARDRLATGWGLGSYPTQFMRYNTQYSRADGLPVYYANAHSDWLQWLAELGLVGLSLILLAFAAPFLLLARASAFTMLPRYLLGGCVLVLLYACVEFPLANPAVLLTFWACWFAALRHARLDATAPA